MKSGFIALSGLPNAGKSSLLNALLKEEVAIVSPKAETTRNAIIGVLNRDDYQMIFLDTPGMHEGASVLGSYMNKEAFKQADGADVIFYMVDAKKGLSAKDDKNLEILFKYERPIFLILNKIDLISKDLLIKRIAYASEKYDFKEIIPISVKDEDNLDELLKTAATYFKDEIAYYPSDYQTNADLKFRTSEIIRLALLKNCAKEVPHLVAVKIDTFKETAKRVYIEATIVCAKDNHKAIIIGKNGRMLQKINRDASKDLSELYSKKCFLSLFVKVMEDWYNSKHKLLDLGYFIDKDD